MVDLAYVRTGVSVSISIFTSSLNSVDCIEQNSTAYVTETVQYGTDRVALIISFVSA